MKRLILFSLMLALGIFTNNAFSQKQVYPLPLDSTIKLSAAISLNILNFPSLPRAICC